MFMGTLTKVARSIGPPSSMGGLGPPAPASLHVAVDLHLDLRNGLRATGRTCRGSRGRAMNVETICQTRILLLIEDNAGDAELVRDFLAEAQSDGYEVLHTPRLSDALERLRTTQVDVILLDLNLPDSDGIASLKAVQQSAKGVPIVVLTGEADEHTALACIDAGAQDYLSKGDVRSRELRRAIGYAITRQRESQLRELRDMLERYRALSSSSSTTMMTAALSGSGAVSVRLPDTFAILVADYTKLLEAFIVAAREKASTFRFDMERIVATLGDANGGPRDLIDVHVAAFDRVIAGRGESLGGSFVLEGRLVALEMMGILVDYYRVGHRRRSWGGAPQ